MPKLPFCALTHVRHETTFLDKWIAHYSAIVGRENLHVVIDGDDWEPRSDLTGIQVEVIRDAPRRRILNDRFMAKEMSGRANDLRRRYAHVLRMDTDEYVVIDPDAPVAGDWEAALVETGEPGYVFALGIDVIQRGRDAPPVDPTRHILRQRPYGLISARYSKPFVLSRWAIWTGGAHRLVNREVRMSRHFRLFHLAQADLALAEARYAARGGEWQHKSHVEHQSLRFGAIDDAALWPLVDFDPLAAEATMRFGLTLDGSPAPAPEAFAPNAAMAVRLPDRFLDLL